jgi:hypothetical protein
MKDKRVVMEVSPSVIFSWALSVRLRSRDMKKVYVCGWGAWFSYYYYLSCVLWQNTTCLILYVICLNMDIAQYVCVAWGPVNLLYSHSADQEYPYLLWNYWGSLLCSWESALNCYDKSLMSDPCSNLFSVRNFQLCLCVVWHIWTGRDMLNAL